jgi:hypothetical protein
MALSGFDRQTGAARSHDQFRRGRAWFDRLLRESAILVDSGRIAK